MIKSPPDKDARIDGLFVAKGVVGLGFGTPTAEEDDVVVGGVFDAPHLLTSSRFQRGRADRYPFCSGRVIDFDVVVVLEEPLALSSKEIHSSVALHRACVVKLPRIVAERWHAKPCNAQVWSSLWG